MPDQPAPKTLREDEFGAVFITESDYDDKRDEAIASGRPWDRRDWHVVLDPVAISLALSDPVA